MKHVKFLLIILSLSFQNTNAQCVDEKFGCDTITTNNNLSNYTEYYKQRTTNNSWYIDAYGPWKWLFLNAPKRTKNLYIHGPKILKGLIDKEEDEVRKTSLIDTLLLVYDYRNKHYPGKEGYVLALKGKDMYKYRTNTDDELNTCQSILQKSFELDGFNSTATTITYYFKTTVELKAKGVKTNEELIALFSDLSEVIDYRQASISEEIFQFTNDSMIVLSPKQQKVLKKLQAELTRIEKAKKSVESTFEKTITDCSVLVSFYDKKFNIKTELNKKNEWEKEYGEFISTGDQTNDQAWLKRAARLLIKKECVEEPIYLEIVTLLHEINPTPESAYNMGIRKLKNSKYTAAITYFEEALNNAVDNINKAKYAYSIAKTHAAKGNFSSAKSFALKAANFRKSWGEPYIFIGNLYAKTASKCGQDPVGKRAGYWAAIEKFKRAKNIDTNCSSKANKLINSYKDQVPNNSMLNDGGYLGKSSYTINCWYTETVKVKTSKDIK